MKNVTIMSKKESEPASTETADDESSNRLTGWRQHCIIASVFMGLFLSFLDTTIVAVALPTISDQFGGFARSSWVITAYLLTYMAFGIILARLSDFFGSKAIEVTSLVLFLIFSIACAVSQNMFQLIVFRALQGIGGSGLYSMTMVINLRIVSPRKMPLMAAVLSLVQVVSGVLGPVLGGAMAHSRTSDTWRWIFWINLPLGGVALATIMVAWPHEKGKKVLAKAALSSIDFLGAFLLLAFSILLVFALVEAGTRAYSWGSAAIIVSLVLSGLSLVAFVAWQEILTRRPTWPVEGIFPLEVVKMRVMGSTIL